MGHPTTSIVQLEPAGEIPSSFGASLKSWWKTGDKTMATSEERLLRRLSFYQSSLNDLPESKSSTDSGVVATSSMVPLKDPKQFLNTLAFQPTQPASPANVPAVLLHGYGAGLGFFYRNFPSIGQWVASRHTPVYAVDWLGMGRSSRPPFRIHAKREDTTARVAEAENFFIDALEEWRQNAGLSKMTLIGHSLGAYLSVAYTLRHPDRVNRLVLLSPAGIPEDPNSEDPSREVDPSPAVDQRPPSPAVEASQTRVQKIRAEQKQKQQAQSRARRLFMYLWEEGWSPFQVVRSSFFLGPMIVGKYSSRRFTGLTEEETREMHDYILNITLAKGSGEYSISHLLAPGAIARMPLVNRIAAIKVPVTFVYGDHDWMDPAGGTRSVEILKAAGNREVKMVIIPNAGHHVYLDNAPAVNDLLVKELDRSIRS